MKIITFLLAFISVALARVTPRQGYGPGEQDWGFVDVREGAHMFYWLFYTQADNITDFTERPLVIWLQGGPGASSTGYGNFAEIGPLHVNGSSRQLSWVKHANVLFIDNPVGSGFSYVDDIRLLASNNTQIGNDMLEFLKQFLAKFPDFSKTPVYLFGESYGGKMAVEIARQVNKAVKNNEIEIDLKAVTLVDSWISTIETLRSWAPYLLYMGLIELTGYTYIQERVDVIENAMEKEDWARAMFLRYQLVQEVMYQVGNVDFYNILTELSYEIPNQKKFESLHIKRVPTNQKESAEIKKLMNGPVREALGIDPKITHGSQKTSVLLALVADFMIPVVDVVEELLNTTEIQINVFCGQLDVVVPAAGTVSWVNLLKWPGQKDWLKLTRSPLMANDIIQGYHKGAGRLHLYWFNRAGHMVPKDNPVAASEVLNRITGLAEAEPEPETIQLDADS